MTDVQRIYKYFINLNVVLLIIFYLLFGFNYLASVIGIATDKLFKGLFEISLTCGLIMFLANIVLFILQTTVLKKFLFKRLIQGFILSIINPGVMTLMLILFMFASPSS